MTSTNNNPPDERSSKIILGLDISTSTVGIGILSKDENNKINLLHSEYYKPIKLDKNKCELDRIKETYEHINKIIDIYKPDFIFVEEYLKFMKGKSNNKSILNLAIINRSVSSMIYSETGIKPIFLNVQTVRSKIKLKGHKGKLSKEDVPNCLSKRLGVPYPYIYSSRKRKGQEGPVVAEESYDMADAIAVALYGAMYLV